MIGTINKLQRVVKTNIILLGLFSCTNLAFPVQPEAYNNKEAKPILYKNKLI